MLVRHRVPLLAAAATCLPLLLLLVAASGIRAQPPAISRPRFPPPARLDGQALYNASDEVVSLNADAFKPTIQRQEHATIVEFYNAFCGFCRRYAPHWKAFAADVRAWRGVVTVAAIDCANDQNLALCREYEIMGYPTLRFFPPRFESATEYGVALNQTDETPVLRRQLAAQLRNVSAASVPAHWPHLNAAEVPLGAALDASLPEAAERYAFVIYEPSDSWVASEIALDFHSNPHVKVVRVHSAAIAQTYGLSAEHSLAVVNAAQEVTPLSVLRQPLDRDELRQSIVRFLRDRGLDELVATSTVTAAKVGQLQQPNQLQTDVEKPAADVVATADDSPAAEDAAAERRVQETLAHVKAHVPTVYMADIEHAVWYTLGHEVPQFGDISGDRLEALKRYISVLSRYVPLTASGPELLRELDAYTTETSDLRGEHFLATLQRLKDKWELSNSSAAASQRWVGCQGSIADRRGYTCGLWTLFHYLTVAAANRADADAAVHQHQRPALAAPLETLQAIHGYVKHFFGCTDCSQHFQAMATDRQIWSVASRDEAVLWLWEAHNVVNARLAGDATEDPQFPKVQYPSGAVCAVCHNGSDGWHRLEVLQHLRHVYAAANLSYYGVATNGAGGRASVPQALVGEKRMLDNVFSDLDMRMGILLYAFCIGMMLVAVKLFMRRRGYRKKMYTHDFLGKV